MWSIHTLTVVCTVGAGLAAGVFFAFSAFVMRALGRLPGAEGMRAMQAINIAAPAPLFMLALFGTAVGCIGLGISALTRLDESVAVYQLIGSLLYLVAIVVTIAYHVPHNDALTALDPASVAGAAEWARYLPDWTAWNHVRTVAGLASAVMLTIAVRTA